MKKGFKTIVTPENFTSAKDELKKQEDITKIIDELNEKNEFGSATRCNIKSIA